MTRIQDEPWFNEPFQWYEEQDYPEIVGVQLTDSIAVDFLQGLYTIYERLVAHENKKAIEDTKQLAVLMLASAFDYGQEAIDQLVQDEFNDIDLDDEFAKMVRRNDENS